MVGIGRLQVVAPRDSGPPWNRPELATDPDDTNPRHLFQILERNSGIHSESGVPLVLPSLIAVTLTVARLTGAVFSSQARR